LLERVKILPFDRSVAAESRISYFSCPVWAGKLSAEDSTRGGIPAGALLQKARVTINMPVR